MPAGDQGRRRGLPLRAHRRGGLEHQAIHGQKTYNGVAILSKHPLTDVSINFLDGDPDAQARIVRATVGGVKVVDTYVPNGNPLGSEKFTYKLQWLARLHQEFVDHLSPDDEVLWCGDFNIAPTDGDVWDPFASDGQVLCTEPERDAFRKMVDWGLVDSWRKKNPFKTTFSWWDYRNQAFRHNHGFRIDHILVTKPLMKRVAKVWIDDEPRGWDRPSDHTPVVVRLKDR